MEIDRFSIHYAKAMLAAIVGDAGAGAALEIVRKHAGKIPTIVTNDAG